MTNLRDTVRLNLHVSYLVVYLCFQAVRVESPTTLSLDSVCPSVFLSYDPKKVWYIH